MIIKTLNTLTNPKTFFTKPISSRQRMYEALRSFYIDEKPSSEVARAFGYTAGAFRVLCHKFRNGQPMDFFINTRPGPQSQPKKSQAKERAVELRKSNHSIYEISEIVKSEGMQIGATAVRELLRAEGFSALPRRLDEERPVYPRVSVEAVANVRDFKLEPGRYTTQCGGLFLFISHLISLDIDGVAKESCLPGSKMIPSTHALRAALALKLWSTVRKSHVMPLVSDPGLALFTGLNVIPKKSFLCEYSSRVTSKDVQKLLAVWYKHVADEGIFKGESFNLDFHSIPYYGEHPSIEKHYVSMRSRSQPSILTFLAHDHESRVFCYSNADLRKGEETDEILRFIAFWKKNSGENPRQLVFDSKLTTYGNLAKIDTWGIPFITLRRRSRKLLKEIYNLPISAWRKVELSVPTRRYRTPRVFEQKVRIEGRNFRQLFIQDLGHEEPTILLTNEAKKSHAALITRYAQRMLIENALSDSIQFFSMNALSSSVGMKVDFDMALLVVASCLYKMIGKRIRGYGDAQARHIFRDIINIPADITVTTLEVRVDFHRRAHLPLILASDLTNKPVAVPWWKNHLLVMSTKKT